MAFRRHSDPIGGVQGYLQVHSKLIADSLYEIQQMKAPNADLVLRLAHTLNASADKLDALISALPDYETDAAAAVRFIKSQEARYVERSHQLGARADSLLAARLQLAAGVVDLAKGIAIERSA